MHVCWFVRCIYPTTRRSLVFYSATRYAVHSCKSTEGGLRYTSEMIRLCRCVHVRPAQNMRPGVSVLCAMFPLLITVACFFAQCDLPNRITRSQAEMDKFCKDHGFINWYPFPRRSPGCVKCIFTETVGCSPGSHGHDTPQKEFREPLGGSATKKPPPRRVSKSISHSNWVSTPRMRVSQRKVPPTPSLSSPLLGFTNLKKQS